MPGCQAALLFEVCVEIRHASKAELRGDVLHPGDGPGPGPFGRHRFEQVQFIAALEDEAFLDGARRHNEVCRQWFADRLTALGLRVHPSAGNFVLVDFSAWGDAEAVRLHLKERGILVRQMGVYKLPSCLRITIGRSDEMHEVAEALAAYRGAKTPA